MSDEWPFEARASKYRLQLDVRYRIERETSDRTEQREGDFKWPFSLIIIFS